MLILILAGCAALIAAATAGMLHGVEPFATWYYSLAWYPTLVAAEVLVRLRTGRGYLFRDAGFAASALAWSVPFWLFFELMNLRISNWYYVFLPPGATLRRAGIVVAFATVLPAVLLSRRLCADLGVARGVRWPRLPVRTGLPYALQAAGVLFFVLALAWPRLLFPLLWGGVTLLADPWVYRHDPERSLLGALERGRPAVILQLLLGGLAIGLIWEAYNVHARAKWIYTVPGLEDVKLFEMPVPGFLGFPVLALDAWAVWNTLVLTGLAHEPLQRTWRDSGAPDTEAATVRARRGPRLPARARALLILAAALLSLGALRGMERWTISSTTPRMEALAGRRTGALRRLGYDIFSLARADSATVARVGGVPLRHAGRWVRLARLATLRGIGSANALRLERLGVRSVAELARADPDSLFRRLAAEGAPAIRPERVRVWVRAASGLR